MKKFLTLLLLTLSVCVLQAAPSALTATPFGKQLLKSSGQQDASTVLGAPQIVNMTQYGAVGDGVTDNANAINKALAYLTNYGGIMLFGPGKFMSSGHHLLPESGGFNTGFTNVGSYQQPGIMIAGSGNTVLHSTDTNPNNGPFWRGGVDWKDIVLEGPGMQYGCTGLVQRIPGNNRYYHVTWQNWGAYGALLDDTTHVMFFDCYFNRCHIGLGYSYKVDNSYFSGRFDFCDYGAELGALGVGSANHTAGTAGGSSSDQWFITANICTNAVMIIGAQSTRQEITAYMENGDTVSTNGYFWIGHDPALFPGGGTVTYNEGVGRASDKIIFKNCKGLQDIGGFVRIYSPAQEITLDGVAYESGATTPLVCDLINGAASIHFKNADAASTVGFTNIDGVLLHVWAGQTVEWTSPQRPGYSLYDRSGITGGAHFESWRYQGAHDGGLRMVWADANDKTMSTPYAQFYLTNSATQQQPYRAEFDGISIDQGQNTSGGTVSNVLTTTAFAGPVRFRQGFIAWDNSNPLGSGMDNAGLFFGNGGGLTNKVTAQAANYAVAATDNIVLLAGNRTATMPSPTAAGSIGRYFTIQCSSAGTNAILPNAAETFSGRGITGAAKWTNSAVGNATVLYSDGTKWWIVHTDN